MSLLIKNILRSEILDDKTCETCAIYLNNITLRADDPKWGGELGMKAHKGCRAAWVALIQGIDPVMTVTPPDEIPDVIRHFRQILPKKFIDAQRIPTRGKNAFKTRPLTVEDIQDIEEDMELFIKLFGVKG